MSEPIENLTAEELKAELIRYAKLTKQHMAPLLYYLREKLKKQGSRTGEGFGAWVAKNLPITRRTADNWANEWAEETGKTSRSVLKSFPESQRDDDLYCVQFYIEQQQQREEFIKATKELGIEEVEEAIYEAFLQVIAKAKARRAAAAA